MTILRQRRIVEKDATRVKTRGGVEIKRTGTLRGTPVEKIDAPPEVVEKAAGASGGVSRSLGNKHEAGMGWVSQRRVKDFIHNHAQPIPASN